MTNTAAAGGQTSEADFFLRYAGHLSVTAGHYDLISDPDSVLERLVASAGDDVTSVEVRGTRHFATDRLIGSLAQLRGVTSVEFVNQDISDRHAAVLADLPALTEISIVRSNALTGLGVALLQSKRPRHLVIVGCPRTGSEHSDD